MLAKKNSSGSIEVDAGAENALRKGKSLLAVGVKKIYGQFEEGEIIEIINDRKQSIAFGLVKKSSDEVNQMLASSQLRGIELVHTDNLIVIG